MKIRVKYTVEGMEPLQRIQQGDWIDLRVSENINMKAGEYKLLPLGVAIELPSGYEALIAPRSSTFRRHGILLANSLGIIDESYKGDNDEWGFPAYATRDILIPKNTRICQFRLLYHQPKFDIETVETLGNPDRGGWGSTGRM